MGPYYVHKAILEKGTYELEEFDRILVPSTHSRNQLKKFVKRKGFYILVDVEEEEESEVEEEDVIMSNTNKKISEATLQPRFFEIVLLELTTK